MKKVGVVVEYAVRGLSTQYYISLLDKSWNISFNPVFSIHLEISDFSQLSNFRWQGVPGVGTPNAEAFHC